MLHGTKQYTLRLDESTPWGVIRNLIVIKWEEHPTLCNLSLPVLVCDNHNILCQVLCEATWQAALMSIQS